MPSTANAPFSASDQVFPDTVMTVAAVGRLVHHATVLEMDVDGYRRAQSGGPCSDAGAVVIGDRAAVAALNGGVGVAIVRGACRSPA